MLSYGEESPVEFGWIRGSETLTNGAIYSIFNGNNITKLTIQEVKDNDYGLYICTAKSAFGNITETIKLRVKGNASFI